MRALAHKLAVAASALTLGASSLLAAATLPAAASVTSCTAATPAASRPLVKRGDTGSCVKALQEALNAKGYSAGTADGQFGAKTDLAVRRYQQAYLNLGVDGIVGRGTWTQLVEGGGTPYSTSRGPNTSSKVMLTFDDCPTSYASFQKTVLAAEALGIRLALFPYGRCAEAGRVDYSYARAHGHYVFNHSYSHPVYTTLSPAQVQTELTRGAPGSYGRPPFGAYDLTTRNAFASQGRRIWNWSVDTNDWRGKSQTEVVRYVLDNTRAGDTVLMHMQHAAFNADALTKIKDGLAAKGLQVCHNSGPVGISPRTLSC